MNDDHKEQLEIISNSWGEDGFLGKLREGIFNKEQFNELYAALRSLKFDEEEVIDRETIRLIWFIPIYMNRLKRYFPHIPSQEYDDMTGKIEDALGVIIGYP
jgi:hypothetical protein